MDILNLIVPCKVIVARLAVVQQIPMRGDLAWLNPLELFEKHSGLWHQIATESRLFVSHLRCAVNMMLIELIVDDSGVEIIAKIYTPKRAIFDIRSIRLVYNKGKISLSPVDLLCSDSEVKCIHTTLMSLVEFVEKNDDQY